MTRAKVLTKAVSAVAVTGLGLVAFAVPAFADTVSTASANAVSVGAPPAPLISSGTKTATNTGGATDVESSSGDISLLPTQNFITAGVFQQTAEASNDGTSEACAGLVGNGGTINLGDNGACPVTGEQAGGVTLDGKTGIGIITADAITESCQAKSDGSVIAVGQLIHATALAGAVNLPINPPPNDKVVAGLLELNDQSTSDGVITATALSIPLLGVKIGTVTCGPNALTGPSSAFPAESWPIAAGTLAVLGIGYLLWAGRRSRPRPVS